MVIARSPHDDERVPLPRFNAQVCVLEYSAEALERIGKDTDNLVQYIDEMLDNGKDILLDPRKHDLLLFDDDRFSRSRKYWWASNMLVELQKKIEKSREVHQKLVNDLIRPINKGIDEPPNSIVDFLLRESKAYKRLEELLYRIADQQKHVEALRAGVSIYSRILHLTMFLKL
jgi:hypothetical protein